MLYYTCVLLCWWLLFIYLFILTSSKQGKWIHQRRVWTGTTYVGWFSHNEGHEDLSLWKGMCTCTGYSNPPTVVFYNSFVSKCTQYFYIKHTVSCIFYFFSPAFVSTFPPLFSSISTTLLLSRLGPRPEASSGTRGWMWENFNSVFFLFVCLFVFLFWL